MSRDVRKKRKQILPANVKHDQLKAYNIAGEIDSIRLVREVMRESALSKKTYVPVQHRWDRFAKISTENQKSR